MSKQKEIWKDADYGGFYEGLYEVSNWGRWKIKPRIVNSSFGVQRLHIAKERITYGTNSNGYRTVMMKKDGIKKQIDLHILVGLNFVPNPHSHPQVLHKDDIRSNNYYENLEWGTQKKNIRDAIKRGRMKFTKGSERSTAKITEKDVTEIREMYRTGKYSQRKLADIFGICYSNVKSIIDYRRWKHIP